jgi:hypothetical protein
MAALLADDVMLAQEYYALSQMLRNGLKIIGAL